jgi:hypothetical protein
MTYLEQAQLAENGEFQSRVRQAAITAAVAIMAMRPMNTPQKIEAHSKRAEYAKRLLNDPTGFQRALTMSVLSSPTVTGLATSDSDIQVTVNAMWDAWAGVVNSPQVTV